MVGQRLRMALIATALGLVPAVAARGDEPVPVPGQDQTFRPTVIVRRGTSQGSGTVIASVPGETLVLTASHVLDTEGPTSIEIHRYNLGLEKRRSTAGFPRTIAAKIVAIDRASDLAVLKVTGFESMPFVARLAGGGTEAPPGLAVVSVGIDLGASLASWGSKVVEPVRIDLNRGGGARPFLLVEKPPEHGRSGGGLFAPDGSVVGVCIGRAEVVRGQRFGVFASGQSIRRLLRENGLDVAIARSMTRRLPRPAPADRPPGATPAPPPPAPPPAAARASSGA